MIRDIYKSELYFDERIKFYTKSLRRFLDIEPNTPKDRLKYIYSPLSDYFMKLVYNGYSKGENINEVYKNYKLSLKYYTKLYHTKDSIYTLIDYFSLAVLFEERKSDFIEDIEEIFNKYLDLVDEGEQLQDDYIDFLGSYLVDNRVVNFHSRLEYLNMIGDTSESVIEAQKFWYYAHSEAWWYDTHKRDDAYDGYWSFDTAALCKIRGIYDERFKKMDFFPYDLLIQDGE